LPEAVNKQKPTQHDHKKEAREQAGKLFNVSGRTVGAFEAVRGRNLNDRGVGGVATWLK